MPPAEPSAASPEPPTAEDAASAPDSATEKDAAGEPTDGVEAEAAAAAPVAETDPLGVLGGNDDGAEAADGGADTTDIAGGLAAFKKPSVNSLLDDEESSEWADRAKSPRRHSSGGKILAKSAVQLKAQTVKEEQKLKRKGSTLTQDVKAEKLTLPLELNGNPFLSVENCQKCQIPFDFIAMRQYVIPNVPCLTKLKLTVSHPRYCRLCREVFCVTCTPIREPIPERGFEDRVPMCDKCDRDRKAEMGTS